MNARTVKPASWEPQPLTRVVIVEEVCPCGSRYISGSHRDPVLFKAWALVHEPHGLRVEGR